MAPKSHGAGDLRLRAFVLSGWTGRHCAHTRRSEMIGLARPHMRFDQLAAYVVDLTPDWVAGITDLENHVIDGCVEGHCDCMYMVNTYRWDYPMVAAMIG